MATATAERPKTTAQAIAGFFEMRGTKAIAEMRPLTPDDKAQLANGINDGSLTY